MWPQWLQEAQVIAQLWWLVIALWGLGVALIVGVVVIVYVCWSLRETKRSDRLGGRQ